MGGAGGRFWQVNTIGRTGLLGWRRL